MELTFKYKYKIGSLVRYKKSYYRICAITPDISLTRINIIYDLILEHYKRVPYALIKMPEYVFGTNPDLEVITNGDTRMTADQYKQRMSNLHIVSQKDFNESKRSK